IKLYNPEWTSFGYLASAQGPFKSLFLTLSSEPFLAVVDTLNISALVLVGLTLVAGFFEKLGAVIAILLLAMYYLAHPSFPWLSEVKVEGSYWFDNKNLIELVACVIIFQYPTGQFFGLTYFFKQQH
ncbi:MAG: DoxX subfamily, partial [Lutibacter sp.]|nr:DoxX subfamily [Lutibacter sp.]